MSNIKIYMIKFYKLSFATKKLYELNPLIGDNSFISAPTILEFFAAIL